MRALEVPRLIIRPARVGDVPGIYEQILVYAEQKQMIRRSMAELYESIREFIVAVDDDNRVVGCVALHVFWEDLAEIRGLAVAEHVQGMGVGRRLVEACWESARESRDQVVFTLTNAVGFFERCGYHRIDKSELPQTDLERMRALSVVPELPGGRTDSLDRARAGNAGRCHRTWRPPISIAAYRSMRSARATLSNATLMQSKACVVEMPKARLSSSAGRSRLSAWPPRP